MEFWTSIGTLAAVCGAISLIPEVIKASRTHHLQDVSWAMLVLLISSSLLWVSYGIHMHDMPLILSGVVNMMMESVLIGMKIQYEITKKPFIHWLRKKNSIDQTQIAETEDIKIEVKK